jgi:hypothetical protein
MPNEQAEIKRVGGTPVKNSGRGLQKGDFILGPFLGDIKEYGKSFAVTQEMWAKISTDSIKNGKRQPTLRLVIGEEGKPRTRLWVIGDSMFQEMLEAWQEKYEGTD